MNALHFNSEMIVILKILIIIIIQTFVDTKEESVTQLVYRDVKCNKRKITSMTKLRDDSYFISTSGHKYWLISDKEDAEEKNSRSLDTITKDWDKVDASMFYGLDVECGLQLKDNLILLNFNDKTNQNEVIYGSLDDWKWTLIPWNQLDVFKAVADRYNWNKSIDDIAVIEESVFVFQDQIQTRIDCVYRDSKWIYEISDEYREIALNGPIDAIYFGDQHKDIYPLYAVREDFYYICYIEKNNKEFPICERFSLFENSLTPKPTCRLYGDPNRTLWKSLIFQMLLELGLIVVMLGFGANYLWKIWTSNLSDVRKNLSDDKQKIQSNELKPKTINDKAVKKETDNISAKEKTSNEKKKRVKSIDKIESPVTEKQWTEREKNQNYQTFVARKTTPKAK